MTTDLGYEHAALVRRLKKHGGEIELTLNPDRVDLWHAATGVVGEAGELIDAVKKHIVHNQPLDIENVVEELGDIEYYLEQVRQRLDIDRESTLLANITKLTARYGAGTYSDAQAQARADKS